MARRDTFSFRVNERERQMLETLAEKLQRTQSDAVRLLVREAVAQLEPESTAAGDGDQRQEKV